MILSSPVLDEKSELKGNSRPWPVTEVSALEVSEVDGLTVTGLEKNEATAAILPTLFTANVVSIIKMMFFIRTA